MLVNPVTSSNAIGSKYPSKAFQSYQASPIAKFRGDSVELSGTAKAKSLELQGFTASEIAAQMGLTVPMVKNYLGTPAGTSNFKASA